MKQTTLEPGLLSVFRIFTALRLGFILLTTIFHLVVHQEMFDLLEAMTGLEIQKFLIAQDTQPSLFGAFITIGDVILLAIYLWWSPLQRWLGWAFLPIGLVIATLGPIISQQHLILYQPEDVLVLAGAWQLVVVLFLPLVLIGWQYNFHMVLRFSVGTAVLDAGLTILTIGWGDPAGFYLFLSIIFIRTILYTVVGYMITKLMMEQRQQQQALAKANTRLTHYATTLEQLSTSRERNRLARELHDTLAHTLSGVTIQLEAAYALWDTDPPAAHTILAQSLTTTRTGLVETRRALQALRASPLDDLGLALALRNLAETTATRLGLKLDLNLPKNLADLNPTIEQCIYRVAQEAIANVDRHAQASHLTMQLDRANHHLTLTVRDDGRGFVQDEVQVTRQFGLKGMIERTEMVGGTLKVDSQPGEGTTVCLTVPVDG